MHGPWWEGMPHAIPLPVHIRYIPPPSLTSTTHSPFIRLYKYNH